MGAEAAAYTRRRHDGRDTYRQTYLMSKWAKSGLLAVLSKRTSFSLTPSVFRSSGQSSNASLQLLSMISEFSLGKGCRTDAIHFTLSYVQAPPPPV